MARITERLLHSRLIWPLLGLLLLLLFNLIFTENFFRIELRDGHLYGTLVDIFRQSSKVMLLAIGMTLVIATGGIDLSVGSIMAYAGALAALLITATELPFPIVIAAALALALAGGVWNGVLVAWVGIQPVVATLILMVAGRGIAMFIVKSGNGQITFEHAGYVFIANGYFLGLPIPCYIVAVMLLLTMLIIRGTAFGLFVQAAGDNPVASRFAGLQVKQVLILVYAWCGLCAGIAGLIEASNIKMSHPQYAGVMLELDAIFAVIVGGTALSGGRFTIAGSIIGALLLQTLTITMYQLGVPSSVAPVPKAVVIIIVCLLQSSRLRQTLARRFRRKEAAA